MIPGKASLIDSGFLSKQAEPPLYVQVISQLETLDIYTKLNELLQCREVWSASSGALDEVFRVTGIVLVRIHAYDLVHFDYLSGSQLKEIAGLSNNSMEMLALELIDIFATSGTQLSASVWMCLAAIICDKTKQGEGQIALKRLLNSNSAKLASTVEDGEWKEGLYPITGENDIAAGLVWLKLGSPSAVHRWRAAHSIRCFARLGKWEVIDAIIDKYTNTDAHPFQAPELSFYYLHARLWFLIAIARVAMDYPQNVARYAGMLKSIATDNNVPHVLLRHFAAQALLACDNSVSCDLVEADFKMLEMVNKTPFPWIVTEEYPRESFYIDHDRPSSMPQPNPEFHIDYDFDKTDITRVANLFDRSRWEIKDIMTKWVRTYDHHITSMYDKGGRSATQGGDRIGGMTATYHRYGQQIGWHAFYLMAGDCLASYPIVKRPSDDNDPWGEWFGRELLTRNDGFWLADGVDRAPLDSHVILCEKDEKGLVITGDRVKLLSLLNLGASIGNELVVAGDWRSVDGVDIRITSALAPSSKAKLLATQLSHEDPFLTWLPLAEGYDDGSEIIHSERKPYKPWIVFDYIDPRLDATDAMGATAAVRRYRFTKEINGIISLSSQDPFGRTWVDSSCQTVMRSEAWNCVCLRDRESSEANRMMCRSDFLSNVLMMQDWDLVVLIIIRRNEKGYNRSLDGKYWHTSAVVRIDRSLGFEFYLGAVNKPFVPKL